MTMLIGALPKLHVIKITKDDYKINDIVHYNTITNVFILVLLNLWSPSLAPSAGSTWMLPMRTSRWLNLRLVATSAVCLLREE